MHIYSLFRREILSSIELTYLFSDIDAAMKMPSFQVLVNT